MTTLTTTPVLPSTNGTTATPSTTSTVAVMKTLRRLFLDYRNTAGWTARAYLDERLYDTRANDMPLTFPYAVMRLDTVNLGTNHGQRLEGTLEVQVHGRPWAQQEMVGAIADLFDQAMLATIVSQQKGGSVPPGLLFCTGWQRQMLPVGTVPIDSEVVTVRLVYTLAIWPAYLTQITTILPP